MSKTRTRSDDDYGSGLLGSLAHFVRTNPDEAIGYGSSAEKSRSPYGYGNIKVFEMPLSPELRAAKDKFGSGTQDHDRLLQRAESLQRWDRCARRVWGHTGRMDACGHYFNWRTPNEISQFLTLMFGRRVQVYKVLEACHYGNGFPVWHFAFIYLEPDKGEKHAIRREKLSLKLPR